MNLNGKRKSQVNKHNKKGRIRKRQKKEEFFEERLRHVDFKFSKKIYQQNKNKRVVFLGMNYYTPCYALFAWYYMP